MMSGMTTWPVVKVGKNDSITFSTVDIPMEVLVRKSVPLKGTRRRTRSQMVRLKDQEHSVVTVFHGKRRYQSMSDQNVTEVTMTPRSLYLDIDSGDFVLLDITEIL